MKKSEYDALKLKLTAELQEAYEKNRSLVRYGTQVECEAGSVSWAIGQVLQVAYAKNCQYHYAAAMDAIEDFALHHWSEARCDIVFEPEDVTGHHPDMAASGPWPQLGITEIDSASPAQPYIPTYQAEPKEEEKPPEDDSWPGHKPQAAAEDFSAIAKRMKELAAEKGNS